MMTIKQKNLLKIRKLNLNNSDHLSFIDSRFGSVPLGSVLSNQCPLLSPGYKVYCNIPSVNVNHISYESFPSFPLVENKIIINQYIANVTEPSQLAILLNLKVNNDTIKSIEETTRDQANSSQWHQHRHNRFTATILVKTIETNSRFTTKIDISNHMESLNFQSGNDETA